jgi:hypothetical protein
MSTLLLGRSRAVVDRRALSAPALTPTGGQPGTPYAAPGATAPTSCWNCSPCSGSPGSWLLTLTPIVPGYAYCVIREEVPLFEQAPILQATLGLKRASYDTAPLLPPRVISSVPVPGVGVIYDSGAESGSAMLRFDFTEDDTAALLANLSMYGVSYYMDVQSQLGRYVLELGTIPLLSGGPLG